MAKNNSCPKYITSGRFKNEYWKYYLVLESDVLEVEPYVSFHQNNYGCFSNQFIKLYQAICSEVDVICKKYCEYIKFECKKSECEISNEKCIEEIETDKEFCKFIKFKDVEFDNYPTMKDYKKLISKWCADKNTKCVKQIDMMRSKFIKQNVKITRSECSFTPWEEWSRGENPEWWEKYNDVKHNRSGIVKENTEDIKYNYQYANLKNVISALAALYVLEKYFYADIAYREAPLTKIPIITIEPYSRMFDCFEFDTSFHAMLYNGI